MKSIMFDTDEALCSYMQQVVFLINTNRHYTIFYKTPLVSCDENLIFEVNFF